MVTKKEKARIKNLEWNLKKDPYYGQKINSIHDLRDRIGKIFDETPGLRVKSARVLELCLPYQGRFLLPSRQGFGQVMRSIPGLKCVNGMWSKEV